MYDDKRPTTYSQISRARGCSYLHWYEHYVDDFIIGVLEFKEGSYFNVLLYSLVPYKTSFVSLYLIIKDLI